MLVFVACGLVFDGCEQGGLCRFWGAIMSFASVGGAGSKQPARPSAEWNWTLVLLIAVLGSGIV